MCENITYIFVSLEGYCVTLSDILINVLILCTGVIIVLINGWIFLILFRSSNCHHGDSSHCFIENLAAADFLIGVFVIYDVIYNVLQFKIFIECVLRIGLFISMNVASVFSLAALTVDRYIKITYPYFYMRKFSRRKTRIIGGIVWAVSIIIGILPFFGWNTKDILHICNYFGIMEPSYLLFIMAIYYVSFIIMVIVYARVSILARRHAKSIRATLYRSTDVTSSEKSLNTFRTAFLIVGAFFVCWTPSGVFTLIVVTSDIESHLSAKWSENVIITYLLGIGILNSILNPVIYATKVNVVRERVRNHIVIKWIQRIRDNFAMKRSTNNVQSSSSCHTITTRIDDITGPP